MARAKLTTEEVNLRLAKRHLHLVGEWQGKVKKHRFACLVCGHEWVATGNGPVNRGADSKQTSGCPACNAFPAATKLTTEVVNLRIAPQGVKLVGEWQGAFKTNRFKCQLGHEWEVDGRSVLTEGNGCPECARLNQKNRLSRAF